MRDYVATVMYFFSSHTTTSLTRCKLQTIYFNFSYIILYYAVDLVSAASSRHPPVTHVGQLAGRSGRLAEAS